MSRDCLEISLLCTLEDKKMLRAKQGLPLFTIMAILYFFPFSLSTLPFPFTSMPITSVLSFWFCFVPNVGFFDLCSLSSKSNQRPHSNAVSASAVTRHVISCLWFDRSKAAEQHFQIVTKPPHLALLPLLETTHIVTHQPDLFSQKDLVFSLAMPWSWVFSLFLLFSLFEACLKLEKNYSVASHEERPTKGLGIL